MKSFTEIQQLFKIDNEAAAASIREYEQAKRYYHGTQLPRDVEAGLKARGQIPITENIYKVIVDKIMGYKSESIQEIKLSGRQEQDKALATLLNDLLKVFSQQEDFDSEIVKRDKELILGMAVMEIWAENDKEGDYHISIKSLPANSFIIDKHSVMQNAKDARRFHKLVNMNVDEANFIFGKEVRPQTSEQFDERVVIIETWIKESFIDENGEAYEAFSRYCWNNDNSDFLSYEPEPFKTREHPFVVCKYQVDTKNQWYGLFRSVKALQDYINLAENRMLNMMSSMKIFYEEGAVLNPDEFVEQAALDNAVVAVRDGTLQQKKIEFVQHQNQIAALSNKVSEKLNLAKILSGLNDEALGMAVNRQSGVAIQQRRDTGLMGLGEYIKISDEMDKLIFKKALSYITHYFTKKQAFKIVDKEVGERYFTINEPQNPNSLIRAGKFDLIYKTQLKIAGREERFAHWSELLKSIAQIRPDIVPNLLPLMLKDTDSPVIDDVKAVLKQADEAQAQAAEQNTAAQQAQELEIQKLAAQVAELQAKAAKYQAQSEVAQSVAHNNAQILQNENASNAQNGFKSAPRAQGVDLR